MEGEGSDTGKFLMERTWEKIQQKTFTKWVNSHLRKRKLAINDLQKDFGDGVLLIQFLEIISGQTLPKYEKKPKIRIQKIGNVSTALDFLKSQKIHLVNISAEDLVDENLKLILGLIWTIIQKFAIDDISEEQLSAKEALLLWCQKKTAGYKDVKVDNFTWSFQDGLALCALINRHRPDLLDFSKLNKENKAQNLQLAFDVAERDLGIPKLLDVEDMVDIKPDERSVITYVSQYYHVFSKYNQAEVAGRRIGKLVDLTEQLEGLKNDYGDKAKRLVDWINKVTPEIQERDFDNTLEGVKTKIDDFKQYKGQEKPPKTADKAEVEALFNNIALKLRANNRPAFEPPAGHSPQDIDGLWKNLGEAERSRDQALRDELRRQERIEHLRRRFGLKAGKLEAWLDAKENYLGTDEPVASLNEAQTKLKNHDAFDQEYSNARPRLDAVQQLAQQLVELGPLDANEISAKSTELGTRFDGLAGPQATKRTDLEEKLAREQKKEQLRKEWARLSKQYIDWNKEQSNVVNDHYFGDTLEAVQNAKERLDSTDSSITSDSTSKKGDLDTLWDELQALGATENQYSPITNKDIEASHNNLLAEIEKRRAAYENELQRQLLLEEKRKEFAQKAQEFVDALNARRETVEGAASGSPDPEAAASAVRDSYQDGIPENQGLASLNNLQNELSALGVRDNKYTQYNLPVLQGLNQKFANFVRNALAALKDEQELKSEYLQRARQLIDWIDSTLPTLSGEPQFDNTLAGARAQRADWQKYLTGVRASRDIDHFNLQSLHGKIANLLTSNKRPAFEPEQPLDPAGIAARFASLQETENQRDSALSAELARQEKLATLVKRFNSDAEELEAWVSDKESYLENPKEPVDDLDAARFKIKSLEVFNSEFAAKQPALDALKTLQAEISSLNYHDIAAVDARSSALDAAFARFREQADAKNTHLREALAGHQANEDLRVSFANQARDFSRFVRDSVDNTSDHNFGFTLDDVTAHKSELDASEAETNARADQLKSALDQLSSQLASNGVSDNRHTNLTAADIDSLRSQLNDAHAKRRAAYEQELERQQNNDDQRKAFAEKTNAFVAYVDQQKEALTALSGEPEERIQGVNSIYQDGAPTNSKVEEIVEADNRLKELGVFDNKYTPYSLPLIQTRKNQFDTSVQNFLQGLKEEQELNAKTAALQAEYERALKLENLRINYSTEAGRLLHYIDSNTEVLTDPIKTDSVADVEELQRAYDSVVAEQEPQQQRHDQVVALATEVTSNGATPQPSVDEVSQRWSSFLSDSQARKDALAKELSRQQANESLRVTFAEQAKAFQAFVQEQSAAVNSPGTGSLQDQLAEVQARRPTIAAAESQLRQLEDLSNRLEEAGVTSNPHTDLNFPVLKVDYEELVKVASNKETLIQKEILRQSNSSVSAEQLAEFKEVFEHFDKDRTGSLGRLEFKSCLQSLGEDLQDAEIDKIIASIGTNGKVGFEAFAQFMSTKAADSDTKPQILEAFKTLAGDKEFVSEEDLRRALPAEKVDYLTKNIPLYKDQPGCFDYNAWERDIDAR